MNTGDVDGIISIKAIDGTSPLIGYRCYRND